MVVCLPPLPPHPPSPPLPPHPPSPPPPRPLVPSPSKNTRVAVCGRIRCLWTSERAESNITLSQNNSRLFFPHSARASGGWCRGGDAHFVYFLGTPQYIYLLFRTPPPSHSLLLCAILTHPCAFCAFPHPILRSSSPPAPSLFPPNAAKVGFFAFNLTLSPAITVETRASPSVQFHIIQSSSCRHFLLLCHTPTTLTTTIPLSAHFPRFHSTLPFPPSPFSPLPLLSPGMQLRNAKTHTSPPHNLVRPRKSSAAVIPCSHPTPRPPTSPTTPLPNSPRRPFTLGDPGGEHTGEQKEEQARRKRG